MPIDSYKQNFKGTLSFITADQPGEMDIAFQILMPGYNYDLGHAGKGPSEGWFFFTSYNSEQANEKLEVNASKNDKDFVAALNYAKAEQCVNDGKAKAFPSRKFAGIDIPADDIERAKGFYSAVFGWQIDANNPMNYGIVPRDGNTNADGVGIGGGMFQKLGLIKPNNYARPYALPPGVPQDRVKAIEAAFQKALRDPELLAEAERSKLNINPISGAELRSMILEGLSMPKSIKEKLRPMLAPAG